jgi:hypothetical protein
MRVLNRVTDLNKQVESFACGQPVLIAKLRNPNPANQFHHEVGPATLRRTGIKDFRDVRVIHHRQGLSLCLKAGDDALRVHPQLDHFERYPPLYGVLLLGHVDYAATPFANLLEQLVAANPIARDRFRQNRDSFGSNRHCVERALHEVPHLRLGREKLLDAFPQRRSSLAGLVKEANPLGRRAL